MTESDLCGEEGGPPPRRTVRDWLIDIMVFALATGIWLALVVPDARAGEYTTTDLVSELVIGSASCLSLWWRRRWPVAITVLTSTIGELASTPVVPIMVFTVAVHRRTSVALYASLATILGYPAADYLLSRDHDSWWMYPVINLGVTAVVLGWGMFVRARRQIVASFRDRAVRAEREQRWRIRQARHLERTRIAREMHDVLAHRLSLLSMHAGAVEFRPDAGPDQISEAAGVIRAGAHQALEELREVIGVLRQNDLMEDGDTPEEGEEATDGTPDAGSDEPELFRLGLDAIPALITEITQAGMEIRYRCALGDTGDGCDVSPRTATTIYRIVQEGLTNARKHSPGAVVDVTITPAPGETVTVEVVNLLPRRAPLHPVPGSGLGLVGLGERVQLIGGHLTHERTPDDHFVLRAVLPRRR
ncbi:MAG: hypothetical protein QG622_1359 [Actinomycetota bacterium]|nr:hypothetical protein [Actinomycetota bacterium]